MLIMSILKANIIKLYFEKYQAMTVDIIDSTFHTKFLTKWLFDVEIFMRVKKIYGVETSKTLLCEKPLNRWVHMDGSKLSFRDPF